MTAGVDRARLADDERGVQPVRGDEIGGLKLPVGEQAVDDLEPERQPLDGLEHGGRLGDAGVERRFILKTISGSIFGEHHARQRQRRVVAGRRTARCRRTCAPRRACRA